MWCHLLDHLHLLRSFRSDCRALPSVFPMVYITYICCRVSYSRSLPRRLRNHPLSGVFCRRLVPYCLSLPVTWSQGRRTLYPTILFEWALFIFSELLYLPSQPLRRSYGLLVSFRPHFFFRPLHFGASYGGGTSGTYPFSELLKTSLLKRNYSWLQHY